MSPFEWNPPVARTGHELADALLFASAGLRRQLMSCAILSDPAQRDLRDRLAQIADELNGLQGDAAQAGVSRG